MLKGLNLAQVEVQRHILLHILNLNFRLSVPLAWCEVWMAALTRLALTLLEVLHAFSHIFLTVLYFVVHKQYRGLGGRLIWLCCFLSPPIRPSLSHQICLAKQLWCWGCVLPCVWLPCLRLQLVLLLLAAEPLVWGEKKNRHSGREENINQAEGVTPQD